MLLFKAALLLFSPGIWFLLPLLASLFSRMTVTKTPSQTKPQSQPVIPATPPLQLNNVHPTPVVVGRLFLCVCVCRLNKTFLTWCLLCRTLIFMVFGMKIWGSFLFHLCTRSDFVFFVYFPTRIQLLCLLL